VRREKEERRQRVMMERHLERLSETERRERVRARKRVRVRELC
jgi:hypothetical protein